jgi:nucleoside-diphosphate-sugar epimerase
MPCMLIFGLGYTASRFAMHLTQAGWDVVSTGRNGSISFDDVASVHLALDRATHVLSSVPPVADGDPVLNQYGDALRKSAPSWIGYLSSTGVYGDTGGAWVDESAPVKGRRLGRNLADRDWHARGAHVFRLPGIYGPGRSALDRVRDGKAHRVDSADQVFSRVHVDDIAAGLLASFGMPAGVYNLADDQPCSQNDVICFACDLLGLPYPALITLDDPSLSLMARAFYAENRRVSNGRVKRQLGWSLEYSTYRTGLTQIWRETLGHSPFGVAS